MEKNAPAIPQPVPYQPAGWRIAAGIGISLALHALALIFFKLPAPGAPADQRTWLTQVEVRLVPPPPKPEPAAESEAQKVEPPQPITRPRAKAKPRRPKETQLVFRPAPAATPQPAESEVEPDPFEMDKRFTAESAKAAARSIAGQLDDPPSSAANAQVNRNAPKYRPSRDERLGRQIQQAARPECKDGIPGGLLAPLLLLMDKKDSGCKW